nr:tetratricopeptide repeat protein [Paenibacillus pinistramenti]
MDANFFFERAVSALERLQYDKALKYFRKAVEYEPGNPVNHCNLAGILSETGDYEGSNEVLSRILSEVDETMTECYFYMANNYANLEKFEDAEEALVTYLEKDADGQFLAEAEEMMELLQYELNRPAKVGRIKSLQGQTEHDQARSLLERGEFTAAVKQLEKLLQEQPDFLAARNNLALGYYYMGMFKEAMAAIEDVLRRDPGNLHGLCNLAVFIQHDGNQEDLQVLSDHLAGIVPFHQEHVFKLATTMGILGRHEAAYGHFKRLLKDDEVNFDPCLFHYAAVAAYNIGRYQEAEGLWKQAAKRDPESEVPAFYLERLQEYKAGKLWAGPEQISYQYGLPFEEQLRKWEKWGGGLPDQMKQDPLVRSSFFWGLRHGDARTKLQIIEAFSQIADSEVLEALRAFLMEPEEEKYLKDIALFALRSLGVNDPLPIVLEGKTETVGPGYVSSRLPVWKPEWQAVLDEAKRRMAKRYNLMQLHDVETLWVEFITLSYPDVPSVSHLGGWAAALEYLTAKLHRRRITFEEAAKRYGVSVSTASRCTKRLDEVCGIKEKMNAMFPSG